MPGRARTEHPEVLDVECERVGDAEDAVAAMLAGTLAGVILRGVLDQNTVSAWVTRLRADGERLPTFRPPVFNGHVFGKPLVGASEGLDDYLEQAQKFRDVCDSISPSHRDIENRIHQALQSICGAMPASVPHAADGRSYLAATIRILVEGDQLPLHYENETLDRPVMKPLSPLLDHATLMSFYLPLVLPEAGGRLRLFNTHCLDGGDSLIGRLGGEEHAIPQFERNGYSVLEPTVGDLLIFDGGRWYHDVTPIEAGSRWTLGGFLAVTRQRDAVLYWS